MSMKQVQIPHDYFFKMAVRDYYAWRPALIREFIQNSVDADATLLSFDYDGDYLTVSDNGRGMNRSTIVNALLTLGGSEKKDNSIGGIGKAKEILYFSWPEWTINTKAYQICGSGPRYEIKKSDNTEGTISRIKIGNKLHGLEGHIREYIMLSNLSLRNVAVMYNGHPININGIKLGEKIYNIEGLGDLHETNVSDSYYGRIIIQAGGLYMFTNYSVLDRCYVFNITQPSYSCLTSNRDSFVGSWQDEFSMMVSKVAIDSESTKLKKETVIQVQALTRSNNDNGNDNNIMHEIKKNVDDSSYEKLETLAVASGKAINRLCYEDVVDLIGGSYLMTESILDRVTKNKIKTAMTSVKKVNRTKILDRCLAWYRKEFPEGFIIVTDEDITTDLAYLMYDRCTLQIAWLWKVIVDDVASRADVPIGYGYGLIIEEDGKIAAQCRDKFLLINPHPYYEMEWEDVALDMLLNASEELVHYIGYSVHNESFKCKYADFIKKALEGRVNIRNFLNSTKKVTKKNGVKL